MSAPAPTSTTAVDWECIRASAVLGIGAVGLAVLLWAASFPGWPLAAGIMVSVLVIAGVLTVTGGHLPPGPARLLRPVAIIVAVIIAAGGGVILGQVGHLALSLRFDRSIGAFDAVAIAAGPVPADKVDDWLPYPGSCPTRIGSYEIAECRAVGGGFVYVQDRRAVRNDAGFVYVPSGMPSANSGSLAGKALTHLSGNWYAWS